MTSMATEQLVGMTNEQLAERIAKRYCALMRLDPEKKTVAESGAAVLVPRWRTIAAQAASKLAWAQAIDAETRPTDEKFNRSYEELRQRCLNHAGMHPSHPGNLEDTVTAAARRGQESLVELARELARHIDSQQEK